MSGYPHEGQPQYLHCQSGKVHLATGDVPEFQLAVHEAPLGQLRRMCPKFPCPGGKRMRTCQGVFFLEMKMKRADMRKGNVKRSLIDPNYNVGMGCGQLSELYRGCVILT